MATVQVVIAIVIRGDSVLIAQRVDDDRPLAGYWEFPGGKVDPGESLESALHREIAEELDIRIEARRALTPIRHDYPTATVELHPFICELTSGEPKPRASQRVQWVACRDLPNYRFPPANDSLTREVVELMTGARKDALRRHVESAPMGEQW